MSTYTLTQLVYSQDRKGPWKLYVYTANGKQYEYISWFSKKPEDKEISVMEAFEIANIAAIIDKKEVRVCDGGDELVYHSEKGIILYGNTFWPEIIKGEF